MYSIINSTYYELYGIMIDIKIYYDTYTRGAYAKPRYSLAVFTATSAQYSAFRSYRSVLQWQMDNQ